MTTFRDPRSMRTLLALAAATVLLGACGKAQESVAEKAAEKMAEAALSKDGTQAKVDMSSGGVKVTTTDAAGKTAQMEMGSAKVSEADVGVPFYPGAKPAEGGTTRFAGPDGSSVSMALHSDDGWDKVAAFYRDKLKAQSEGKQLMDASADGSATLMLNDDKANSGLAVQVTKAESGTDVLITATRGPPKK